MSSHSSKRRKSKIIFEKHEDNKKTEITDVVTVVKPIEKITVWKRCSSARIQNLTPSLYEKAYEFIQNHYFKTGKVCKTTGLIEDVQSDINYTKRIITNIENSYSFVAIDERTETICGVLVFKLMSKNAYYKVYHEVTEDEGKAYSQIMKFFTHINKQTDVFGEMDCTEFFEYHLLCVREDYEDDDLDLLLMITGMDLARYFQVRVLAGIFESKKHQGHATYLGLKARYKIKYADSELPKKNNVSDEDSNFCGIYVGYVLEVEQPPGPEEIRSTSQFLSTENSN